MPTKAFEPLLYRELAKVGAKEVIDIASPLLQELVNYATNAFQRCQTSSTGAEDEDLPILVSYLHVIEMTDGIEVLVSQSCPVPSIPLLRSSFEAQLAIEYILQGDYSRRSFAWLVGYVHQRLKLYELLEPSHERGKEFVNTLSTDQIGWRLGIPRIPDLPQIMQNLQTLLGKPAYQVAEREYQMLKTKRKREPDWYNLFDGPSSLRELARRVRRGAQYDFLYRYWSHIAHASDLSRYLTRTAAGPAAFKSLRNAEMISVVSSLAASIILSATRTLIGKFRPGEESNLKRWYLDDVRDRYLRLASPEQ